MSRWRLDGHRALVTGGTRGIGAAIVAELRELGATVLTVARSGADLCADISEDGAAERILAQAYETLGLIYLYLLKDFQKGEEYLEKSIEHGGKAKFRIVYRRRIPNSKKFGEPAEGWLTINSNGQVGVDNANGNGSAFSIDKKGFNPPPFVEDKKMILTYQSPPKNQRSKTTKEETTISLFLKTGNASEMVLAEKMISSPTRTQ